MGEIKEGQSKRERMRELESCVEAEDKKAGLRQWETCWSGSCLSSSECFHPRDVLVFVMVMPIRSFRQ